MSEHRRWCSFSLIWWILRHGVDEACDWEKHTQLLRWEFLFLVGQFEVRPFNMSDCRLDEGMRLGLDPI